MSVRMSVTIKEKRGLGASYVGYPALLLSILKSEIGVCLAMCLEFPEFVAGCAYRL